MLDIQKYLDQANHNEEFHTCLTSNYSEKFFDWKIIVLFYTSIHYLKALAAKKGIDIGKTHSEIASNCNPKRDSPKMALSTNAYNEYKKLRVYSEAARYEGIDTDIDTFEKLKEQDYKFCLEHLTKFKGHMKGYGLAIQETVQ